MLTSVFRRALALAFALFASTTAMSDPLTPAQLNNLRTAIIADPTAVVFMQTQNVAGLVNWCNTSVSPAQLGWLKVVPSSSVDEAPNYSAYDSLAAGKRDSWVRFLAAGRDFTRNKVRNWVTDVWGNATAGSNAEAVLLVGTEAVTNAQAKLGGTVKTTGTVSALDRVFNDKVTELEGRQLVFKDDGTPWVPGN